ncbi:MAG: hypothetical protein V3S08_01085 [Phycisphaerales bacterium]
MTTAEAAPDILYVPLPKPRSHEVRRSYVVLGASLVASMVGFGILGALRVRLPNAVLTAVALVPIVIGLAGLVLVVVNEIRAVRRLADLARIDSTDDLATATVRLLVRVGVYRRWGLRSVPWKRFDGERTRRGIPTLKIVVDEALREQLAAIGLPDHLVEPERLDPGKTGAGQLAGTTVLGLFAAWNLYRGHMVVGGASAFLFLSSVLLNPAVLASMPIVGDGSRPVAGPGYLDFFGGRRLTVRDSVMIVTRGPRKWSVQVFLTGPAGALCWGYPRIDDPQFVRLWQRWGHPNPRLDFDAV